MRLKLDREKAERDVRRARNAVDQAEAVFTVWHDCPYGTTCPVCMNLRAALRALDEALPDMKRENMRARERAAASAARGNDGNR